MKHKTIPVFVPHLGCPQGCLFCNQKRITGKQKPVSPEEVEELITIGAAHKKEDQSLEIGFFGGSFTGIEPDYQEALLKPAFEAKKKGILDGIRLSTRPDYINEEVICRLQQYGVTTVELGAQSMDDEVLRLSRRGHSAEQTKTAAEQIKKSGIALGLQMMIGLLGDTPEKTLQTAFAFKELAPSCVRIYPTLVIRDTALADLYQQGAYKPLEVAEAVARCCRVYRIFSEAGIDVIRMGLLNMKQEDILAGPYHPSFGELVLSAVCYEKIKEALKDSKEKDVALRVHPTYTSVLCGHKRSNIKRLKDEFGLTEVKLIQSENVAYGRFEVLLSEEAKAKS